MNLFSASHGNDLALKAADNTRQFPLPCLKSGLFLLVVTILVVYPDNPSFGVVLASITSSMVPISAMKVAAVRRISSPELIGG